jgi:hypothetical protein
MHGENLAGLSQSSQSLIEAYFCPASRMGIDTRRSAERSNSRSTGSREAADIEIGPQIGIEGMTNAWFRFHVTAFNPLHAVASCWRDEL